MKLLSYYGHEKYQINIDVCFNDDMANWYKWWDENNKFVLIPKMCDLIFIRKWFALKNSKYDVSLYTMNIYFNN